MISIIVPVYNTEKYLKRCIESILNQTYKDIEIILIDDGSIDASYAICSSYAKEYANIKAIKQENRGVSNTRNRGIDLAKGEYIGFIDSDDYINPNMFSLLVGYLDKGYDLAACGCVTEKEFGEIQQETKGDVSLLKERSDIFKSMFIGDGCGPNVCNKLLKKSIIDTYNIRFPEELKIGEDMVMLSSYVSYCTSGIYDPKTMYHYVTRENSAYHKRFVPGIFGHDFYDEIMSHKIVYTKLANEKEQKAFIVKMYYVYLRALKYLALANVPDKELYLELIKFLRKKLFVYLFSSISVKQKAHALIMTISPNLWLVFFSRRGVYYVK